MGGRDRRIGACVRCLPRIASTEALALTAVSRLDSAGGGWPYSKTYSQISAQWIAGGMKNTTLAGERTTLFMGETLNGLLLNAWGWSVIGSIATLAGFILILLGAVLFLLPLANWQVNLRHRRSAVAAA